MGVDPYGTLFVVTPKGAAEGKRSTSNLRRDEPGHFSGKNSEIETLMVENSMHLHS